MLPSSCQGQFVSPALNVSMAGSGSMISQFRWLAFFDLELCRVHCGGVFGLEFN